jgi:membrane protease YdiL (CAAX protease family)
MAVIVRAVLIGMAVMLAGTLPRNLVFAANLRFGAGVPWAAPVTAAYLWFFWRYLEGAALSDSTSGERRASLRASPVSGGVWAWALLAGGLGIVALVLALHVANRLVVLPQQQLPDLSRVPRITLLSLLVMAAPVAGVVEEAAFRGYMQGPIERRHGLGVAILVTGTMFAVAHLDFTPILWPYYVAVAAIYGTVTHLTRSIVPAVILHTGGNLYSNLGLWLHGKAEWQAARAPAALVWTTGADRSFWNWVVALLVVAAAMAWAFWMLARAVRMSPARGTGDAPPTAPGARFAPGV